MRQLVNGDSLSHLGVGNRLEGSAHYLLEWCAQRKGGPEEGRGGEETN